jgi:NlpC/P60 family putative phage cell wall peptidase
MKRIEIITEARTWLEIKWQHQACLKNVACDCVGLVRGVGAAFGLVVGLDDLNYSQRPCHKAEKLYGKMEKYLTEIPIAEAKPGDVLLFGWGDWPAYHCGIVSYNGFVIHTWLDVGKVVESRLDDSWQENIRYAFQYPGVED